MTMMVMVVVMVMNDDDDDGDGGGGDRNALVLPRRATRPKSSWTDWFTLTKRVILGFDLLYQVLIETSGTCWLMFC